MISRVSHPTRSLVRLTSVLTILCLTASLSSAAESQPRWVTNEVEWIGEVAPCFGFSVSETARVWRKLQAAAESSSMTGPSLHWFFATLAIMTQHAQSTPADAAAALQIFETGFILGHLTTVDVRTLNASLPPAPTDRDASREQKTGRHEAAKRKMYAATGTVYYQSTGSHGGMVLLKTDSGLLDLSLSDESRLNLSDSMRAWDNGAVWQVHYYKKDNGYGHFFLYIDKATFTGEVNSSIDAASTLIKKYYEILARRMYTEAYGLFSEKQKAHTTIKELWQKNDTFTAPGDVDFCSRPKCVDIKIISHGKAKVIIRVDTRLLKKRDQTCYNAHPAPTLISH
jgi:hypothetical protein